MGVKKCTQSIAKSTNFQNTMLHLLLIHNHTQDRVKRDNFTKGIPQCIAQMFGSKLFNEKKNYSIESIYGCVTNADEWQFLLLEERAVTIDTRKYYFDNIPEILGIFRFIIDKNKH